MEMEKGGSQHPCPAPSSPTKRPAGRTKFRETRHPVFRGVRRRGRAGRWVCEVRVPGSGGDRLWVGTFDTPEAAARAHDAAMLVLCGDAASLNFADSASLLDVPRAAPAVLLADIQRAAAEAVATFMRRHGTEAPASAAAAAVHHAEAPQAPDGGAVEVVDTFGGMDAGSYYASLAEGLLMEPPQTAAACPDEEECGGGAEMELWS